MNTKTIFTTSLLLICAIISVKAQDKKLDDYIREAFQNNKVLQQRYMDIDKSMYALKEAKSYFLPSTTLAANYTLSRGGRSIDLPLGDMMNPVYSTLNDLTQSSKFQNLSNETIFFNANNFYDVKLHTSWDIYNTDRTFNKKISEENIKYQEIKAVQYKRQLVKEVKTAWFQYQQLLQEKEILQSALEMADEALRTNQILEKNGRANNTVILRSETEKNTIKSSVTLLEGKITNARAYFNFLLNRPLDTGIDGKTDFKTPETTFAALQGSSEVAEVLQLANTTLQIASLQHKLSKSSLNPKIGVFLDLGVQELAWKVKSNSPYYILGVNLKWDVFSAGRNKYRISQSALDINRETAKKEHLQSNVTMQQQNAEVSYTTAMSGYQASLQSLTLAEKYYGDQLKIYKQGKLLYIELLDAQNQLTQSRQNAVSTLLNLHIAYTELEYQQALYPIKK